MQDLLYFQSLAQEMIAADRERDRMMRAMDDMWHNRWALPNGISGLKWIHKVVSSDPHDAVRAGTRVLSSVAPRITVRSLRRESAEANEKVERALAWQFRNASRRRRASVLRDVVLSALLYDEVIAQVVFLPEQIEAMKQFKSDGLRLDAAKRFGPFAVIVRNPQQVHVRYSDWMPEAVLMKKVMTLQEAVDFWGERAAGLLEARAAKKTKARGKRVKQFSHCTVYDFMDLEQRVVWAVPQVDGDILAEPGGDEAAVGADDAGAVEILHEEHGLGFLPWAAKVGGTTLAEGEGQQRIPLLYSLYTAGHWDTQNIVETLLASEVIAYAAAPRLKLEGPSDSIEVDYGEPGRPAYVPPGHALSPMAPPGLDQSMALIAQRVAERIGKSTVPRVLQSGDFPGGTAFATLNLATQSGIKALAPYKELAEEALAEVFTLMMSWMQHSGQALQGLDTRGGRNELVSISPAELAEMVVEVELTADVPSDRMARINAASMAVRELGYSRERALEQIGETDAKEVMRAAEQEQMDAVDLEIKKQRKLATGQLETKLMLASRVAPEESASESASSSESDEQEDEKIVGGPGFDPANGGFPPVMAAPETVAAANSQNAAKRMEE